MIICICHKTLNLVDAINTLLNVAVLSPTQQANNRGRFRCLKVPSQYITVLKKVFHCLQLHQRFPTPKILSLWCLTAELHQNWRISYRVTLDHCFLGLSWGMSSRMLHLSLLSKQSPYKTFLETYLQHTLKTLSLSSGCYPRMWSYRPTWNFCPFLANSDSTFPSIGW